MKILKDGDVKRLDRVCRFECAACGCIFEAARDEYIIEPGQYNFEDYTATCPCCGKRTYGRRAW